MNLITGSVYNYKLLFIILKNNIIKYISTLPGKVGRFGGPPGAPIPGKVGPPSVIYRITFATIPYKVYIFKLGY